MKRFFGIFLKRTKMKNHVDKDLTVTYEVKEGEWDICKGDPEMQSRVGTYVIVLSIKKTKKNKPIKGSSIKGGVRWL